MLPDNVFSAILYTIAVWVVAILPPWPYGIDWIGQSVENFFSPLFPPSDLFHRLAGKGWRTEQGRGAGPYSLSDSRPYFLNLADWFGWLIPFYPMWGRGPLATDQVLSDELISRVEPVPPKFEIETKKRMSALALGEIEKIFRFYLVRESDGAEKELPIRGWQNDGTFRVVGPLPTPEQLENPENVLVHVEVRVRGTGEVKLKTSSQEIPVW